MSSTLLLSPLGCVTLNAYKLNTTYATHQVIISFRAEPSDYVLTDEEAVKHNVRNCHFAHNTFMNPNTTDAKMHSEMGGRKA